MQIFKHRPLCLILSFLIAFMAVSRFMSAASKIIIVLAAAGISAFIIARLKREDKTFWHRAGIIALGVMLLLIFTLRSIFFYDNMHLSAEGMYGLSGWSQVKITEVGYTDTYFTTIKGDMLTFNGEEKNIRIYLECEYETDYLPGDTVLFPIDIYEPSLLLEDGYTTHAALLSEGYELYCVSHEDSAVLIKHGSGIRYSLEKLNRKLSVKFDALLGEDCGALASALALGDDSKVSDSVMRDFRRSGLAHILSLSGSHIVLIIGTAETVLRKYLKAGVRVRYPIMIASLPFYILFVLSPIPVIRAGVMYAVFCLLQILGKRSDSMTNLFVSAGIMILIRPSLVYSVSLWMSFTATLALIVFLPPVNDLIYRVKYKRRGKLIISLLLTLLLSFYVALVGLMSNIIFLPLFGSFSTVSIAANIFFGPLITVFLCLCMILLILMPFSFAPSCLTVPAVKLCEFLISGINKIASYKYSVVSLNSGYAKLLCVLFFAAAVVFMIVKVKRKRMMLIPVALFAVLLTLNSLNLVTDIGRVKVIGIKDSQSEMLVVSRGDNFSLVDISNGRYSNFSKAARLAKENGACEFESIVLTHYHRYHISAVRRFIQREYVRDVYLPLPNNSYDNEIYTKLKEMLDSFEISYKLYVPGYSYDILENVSLNSLPLQRIERSTHALISFSFEFNQTELIYIGSSVNEGEVYKEVLSRAYDAENIIFGGHGPKQKSSPVYFFSAYSNAIITDTVVAEKYFLSETNGYAKVNKDGIYEFVLK